MSFPRKKLDMRLLILEERSCEVITESARKFYPDWDFNRFEAIQCNAAEPTPEEGNRYDASYIFHITEPGLDALDREVPFLFPLERGKHYLWELFTELPKSGGSRSSRQFWNRLSRAMSTIEIPLSQEEFVEKFEQASLSLLAGAIDMGDRFYLSELDCGGWNGGIVTKDFLIEGLKMLAAKLDGPGGERKKKAAKNAEQKDGEAAAENKAADVQNGETAAKKDGDGKSGEAAAKNEDVDTKNDKPIEERTGETEDAGDSGSENAVETEGGGDAAEKDGAETAAETKTGGGN